jgi:ribosomal protein L20A (L18A)
MLNFKYQIIDAAERPVKNLKKKYSGFGNKYKVKRAIKITAVVDANGNTFRFRLCSSK